MATSNLKKGNCIFRDSQENRVKNKMGDKRVVFRMQLIREGKWRKKNLSN